MGPMMPLGPQRGLWGGRPGPGEPPGRSPARRRPPALGGSLPARQNPSPTRIFGSKKKVEIWPIWTHHEHREARPVIFGKRHGVKNSTHLMSYGRLKLARKKNGPKRPRLPMSTGTWAGGSERPLWRPDRRVSSGLLWHERTDGGCLVTSYGGPSGLKVGA